MAQDDLPTDSENTNNDGDNTSSKTPINGGQLPQIQSQPATNQPSGGQVMASVPTPDEAADSDLIEKEWVERAKQIVDHTKDDPHEQQRAVSQMKADYLKKRYNKDINAAAD